jgi:hypothetical protein
MTRDDGRRESLINKESIESVNTLVEIAGGNRSDNLKDRLNEIVDSSNIKDKNELKYSIEKGRTRNKNQENAEKLSGEASNIEGIEEFFSEKEGI